MTTICCLSLVLVSSPEASASDVEVEASDTVDTMVVEPVVELAPHADPTDPQVQQEIEEHTEEFAQKVAEASANPEPITPELRAQAGAAGFSHFYKGSTPPAAARARIESAIDTWASALDTSSGPIVIEITWRDFGSPNILGSAGPAALHGRDNFITTALWNTNNKTDFDEDSPEIFVDLNSSANWYTGTGSPSIRQVDLESVVLHELAHGLGFIGTGSPDNTTPPASAYDYQATFLGEPYLSSNNPSAALTSGNLQINTSDSHQYHLHAPSTFNQGTSLSHFDEDEYHAGDPGALMTPTIVTGDIHRDLDAPVLGVMSQIGWELKAPLAVPSGVSVSTSNSSTTVSWNTNLQTFSYVPDLYRVEVFSGGSVIASKEVAASAEQTSFSGLPSGTLTFRVTPVDKVGSSNVDGTSASRTSTIGSEPSGTNFISIAGTGLTQDINWPNATGDPDNYVVEISTDGSNWTEIGTPTRSRLEHTFTEGTYQVRVRARNGAGDGPTNTSTFVPVGTTFVRPAPLDHQIRRLYLSTFLREPDQAGFENWRFERAGHRSLISIAEHFAGSVEFQATYGNLNNTEFVEQLYLNVFNRPLDPVGRATWVGLLDNGGSRGEVLARLSDSNESIRMTSTISQSSNEASITRLYLGYFKRLPDEAGFNHWVGELNRGRSLASISDHFAGSNEFIRTYGSLSNSDFVELLYFNILSRNPDSTGFQEWTGRLDSGARTRGSVMIGFSESRELVVLTGTAR